MLSLTLFTLLATSLANPLPNPQPVSTENYITACERASNCETYLRPDGRTGTRFIAGMEPGTPDYISRMAKPRKTKRDDPYPQTHVTIGDHQIPWGCDVDPVAELDHLGDSCKTSGQCDDSDPYERTIGYLNVIDGVYAKPVDTKMSIKGNGNYPAWMRNGLVEAIRAAASGNDIIDWHRQVHWNSFKMAKRNPETPAIALPNGPNNIDPSSGVCDIAVLSSHIGLNVYSAPDNLMATMEATIELPEIDAQKTGFCSIKPGLDMGAAVAGAVGGWATGLGAIFGSISALCG